MERMIKYEKVLMLRHGDRWTLYVKIDNGGCFAVYPALSDVASFMRTINNASEEEKELCRSAIADKYLALILTYPEFKVDIFGEKLEYKYSEFITRVNIFKPKDEDIKISVAVNDEPLEVKTLSKDDWQLLWLAPNMQAFKLRMAERLFEQEIADKLAEQQARKEEEEKKKAENKNKLTPLLKQFYELKDKHPEALLLFRCGDFYETYCDDAEKVAEVVGITLTRSTKTKDKDGQPLAMAGFPYHALDTYLPKLISAGYRVVICDQLNNS